MTYQEKEAVGVIKDKREICPKCHKRVNKLRTITEEIFNWRGDREHGEYVSEVGFYREVHHCGGVIHSEVIQN